MNGVGDLSSGLSPRVRGNPQRVVKSRTGLTSIPACAGEPAGQYRSGRQNAIYPRVCGGTVTDFGDSHSEQHLSPRVRGNPLESHMERLFEQSIPACAGEPPLAPIQTPALAVYPRVCGGTNNAAIDGFSM